MTELLALRIRGTDKYYQLDMKKLFFSILGVFAVVIAGCVFIIAALAWMNIQEYYGNYFSFENELGVSIDSMKVTIGEVENVVYGFDYGDGIEEFSGNLEVPDSGYPHKVSMIIYSPEGEIVLDADSFNCYNCDGSHEYILKESGAEYRFLH